MQYVWYLHSACSGAPTSLVYLSFLRLPCGTSSREILPSLLPAPDSRLAIPEPK